MEGNKNIDEFNNTTNIISESTIKSEIPIIKSNFSLHYLCPDCLIFPFIKFCKDKKHIKLTCLCFNNEKILITDFLDKISKDTNNISTFLTSKTNINLNDDKEIICKKHNKKYEYFCSNCISHYCNNEKCRPTHNYIKLEEIRFDNTKLELLKSHIYSDNIWSSNYKEVSNEIMSNKIFLNNSNVEIITEDIINDYNDFPNFLHYFNLENLFHFYNIKDEPKKNEEKNIILHKEEMQKDEIIIEYKNNILDKTKLFGKTFVKKKKFILK